ncbi:MAG: SGNH/GDSL hydrolase family protein [Tychonema bourrellyi B0820]|uniref:GDSL family lipase n=1 Tax=Tychonema bourrellyi FEM_GT703 TaxID=2040638 RepID=A0A2G4EZI3_9CYAN|nr:SGNH/GDSL hydrolase family protein [Tychonema bourrellyi]MDQ2098962.1 SGNH/GDSL hydrolase family protein [Tychonema bourrellyi B0820]PHX54913.1 GDSL family lipase [Tychonema bourrellyi FEM_GT703]
MEKFGGFSGRRAYRPIFAKERSRNVPFWALLSLLTNGVLIVTVVQLMTGGQELPESSPASAAVSAARLDEIIPQGNSAKSVSDQPISGQRHKWTYQQWVTQLGREAEAVAMNRPSKLTVLVGDSLSMWFPTKLLPIDRIWLNQGISGETSVGLLKRLQLLDRTQPDAVFVMIGINDLLKGASDEGILDNQRQIIRDLRWAHPKAQVVVQSILPHSGEQATWENRDRLLAISNSRIREINRRLREIASVENALYLDLYPMFTDADGNLQTELSTDGLHLNDRGYLVWRSALQLFGQIQLKN